MPLPRADQGGQRLPRWSASSSSTVKEHGSLTVSKPYRAAPGMAFMAFFDGRTCAFEKYPEKRKK
ncbi:MAG: hypothetical protein IJI27_02985, partial [Oscillospiraceae bacterium]|nr:hypothetical protein [Oscillospiraceae bacterium]